MNNISYYMKDDINFLFNEYEDAVAECVVKFSKNSHDKAYVKREFDDYLKGEQIYSLDAYKKGNTLFSQLLDITNLFLHSKKYITDGSFFSMWGNNFFLQPNDIDEYVKKDPDWMVNNIIQAASPRFLQIIKSLGILVGGKRKTKRVTYRKNKRSKTKRRRNKRSKRYFK
jgi:hypothetical protein